MFSFNAKLEASVKVPSILRLPLVSTMTASEAAKAPEPTAILNLSESPPSFPMDHLLAAAFWKRI